MLLDRLYGISGRDMDRVLCLVTIGGVEKEGDVQGGALRSG